MLFNFINFTTPAPCLSILKGAGNMEVYGVIYLITDKTNAMKYVGQTMRSVEVRFKEHCNEKTYIGNAMKKHGIENFSAEILEECTTREQLNEREKFWISELNTLSPNGYNLAEGGNHGGSPSPETRAKMSAANKGRTVSEETRQKISAARSGEKHYLFGKHHTAESRAKMSASRKGNKNRPGKPHTAQAKEQMSLTRKGRLHTAKTCAKIGAAQRGYSPYKNLLNEIDARQFSYRSLAKLMGIASMTVSGKMRCKQNFTSDEIKKLEEIFGKPAEYLLQRN